jgi:rod shape-determining protein MreC
MPLGTLDRTPPPFFRQGPSALSKLVFFSALAVFLMVADSRMQVVQPLRQALAVVLLPLQRAVTVPLEIAMGGTDYLRGLAAAREAERDARERAVGLAERASHVEHLAAENARLRALLELRPALTVRSLPAEVLYEAADPYSRKVFIDRGLTQGVKLGAPVMAETGVLGQVTQVYPLTAEVTLLTDKDAAIPVLNTRTQQRSAAFGGGRAGGMELRRRQARRRAADQRPRRCLPAGAGGGAGGVGGAARGVGLCAHRAGAGGGCRRRAPCARARAGGPAAAATARAGGAADEREAREDATLASGGACAMTMPTVGAAS